MICHATDFGGLIRRAPARVLRPASVDEVRAAVAAQRAPFVARGQGHSTRGHTLIEGGTVLDLTLLEGVVELGRDRVRVLAGTRWSDLVTFTVGHGLTPPVLTDYLGISVGGTLSVGGIGGQSFRHGLQIDNVLELQVVTGEGRLVRCSREHEPALFAAVCGGLGQFGVVVEATLALLPAPHTVHVTHVTVSGVERFVRSQIQIIEAAGSAQPGDGDAFDYVLGNILPGDGSAFDFELECVQYQHGASVAAADLAALGSTRATSMTYLEYVTRLAPLGAIMQGDPALRPRHPWCDLFLSADACTEFLERTLSALHPDELRAGYAMTYPVRNEHLRSVSPALPDATHSLLVAILPSFDVQQDAGLHAYEQKLPALFAHARSLGGTVYPHSFPVGTEHFGSREDWARQLGRSWSELVALKRRYDPERVLGAGVGIHWDS